MPLGLEARRRKNIELRLRIAGVSPLCTVRCSCRRHALGDAREAAVNSEDDCGFQWANIPFSWRKAECPYVDDFAKKHEDRDHKFHGSEDKNDVGIRIKSQDRKSIDENAGHRKKRYSITTSRITVREGRTIPWTVVTNMELGKG